MALALEAAAEPEVGDRACRARSNVDVGRSAGRASLEWTETGC
eukprot:SAG11_NODE_23894_length_381_cov_1.886525_1_plen_42_part_10